MKYNDEFLKPIDFLRVYAEFFHIERQSTWQR